MIWLRNALDRVIGFLPDLIAGLVILLVGYIVARVLASAAAASVVFWVVMLVAVMQASAAWRLTAVAAGLAAVLAYLPHVLAAAAILAAGLLVGNWVHDRMVYREVTVGGVTTSQRSIVAGGVRAFILAIASFMALRELRIAPNIVTIAFTAAVAAIAVATALAFGLGARSVAERVARDWYERRRAEADGEAERAPVSAPRPTEPLTAETRTRAG